MIKLLNLQYQFLYTKKIKLITLTLFVLTSIVLILQSNLCTNQSDFDIHRKIYLDDFIYNGLNLIKIILVIYIMLSSVYAFYIGNYDGFLLNRYSRKKIVFTKLIIITCLNMIISLSLMMFYLILWRLIGIGIETDVILKLLSNFSLFLMYYTVIFSLLIIIFDNLFIIILPFIGYLLSNLSVDYGVSIKELSTTSKLVHLIFPDLLFINRSFDYIYGGIFVLSMVVTFLSLSIAVYIKKDFAN